MCFSIKKNPKNKEFSIEKAAQNDGRPASNLGSCPTRTTAIEARNFNITEGLHTNQSCALLMYTTFPIIML